MITVTIAVVGFVALHVWAAVSDLATMEIPNRISVALVALFLLAAPVAGLDATTIAWSVGVGALWLTIGCVMMGFNLIGGGDVKVAAATVVWMGWQEQVAFLFYTALAGGLLAAVFLVLRNLPRPALATGRPWMLRLLGKEEGIPYAVAIAVGAVATLPRTIWW